MWRWPLPAAIGKGALQLFFVCFLADLLSGIEAAQSSGFRGSEAPQSLGRSLAPGGSAQSWLLQIGNGEPDYSVVTVQAGRTYSALSIQVPRYPCALRNTTGAGTQTEPQHELAAHVHGQLKLEALVHVTANGNASVFLGPSLDDGYEITLASPGPVSMARITRRQGNDAVPGDLIVPGFVNSSANSNQLWLSFRLTQGRGELLVGTGSSLQSDSVVLSAFDGLPPAASGEIMYLWVSTSGNVTGRWEVCLAGDSSADLDAALHVGPMLKLMRPEATTLDCRGQDLDAPVPTTLGSAWPWPLQLALLDNSLVYSGPGFSFMQGGLYTFCYAPETSNHCICSAGAGGCNCIITKEACNVSLSQLHGTCNPFGNVRKDLRHSMLFAEVNVLGIRSTCLTNGCLAAERWDCYFQLLGEPQGSCDLDLVGENRRPGWQIALAATSRPVSRASWTNKFSPDALFDGLLRASYPKACGTPDPPASEFETDGNASVELLPNSLAVASVLRVRPSVSESFTVALCYCPAHESLPGAGPCTQREDYVQQFGVLYMWVVSFCNVKDSSCASTYMRVVPQQRFVTKILCPPGGGCTSSFANRIKFLEFPQRERSLPNWDSNNLCKVKKVEPPSILWPEASDTLNIAGGERVDHKIWAAKQVRISTAMNISYIICYCDGACSNLRNWLQVGVVTTVSAFAFASSAPAVALGSTAVPALAVVNKVGSFTLYGGVRTPPGEPLVAPYESGTFSGTAILNLMSVDNELQFSGRTLAEEHNVPSKGFRELYGAMTKECGRQVFSAILVDGLSNEGDSASHMATSEDPNQYFAFDGPNHDQTLKVKKAGTLAVCYCGSVTPNGRCLLPSRWVFSGFLQIRGPLGGQVWVVPTKIVVAIHDVRGWGFDPTDVLRLVPAEATCDSSDFFPISSTTFKVGCPQGSSSASSCEIASLTQQIVPKLADSSRTGVHVTSIYLESAESSLLTFSGPITHYLGEGDAITLNPDNILVDGKFLAGMTQAQQYDAFALAGMAQFQDDPTATFTPHWHYVSLLEAQEDGRANQKGQVVDKLRIHIGWTPDSDAPKFDFTPGSTQWVRRNLLSTEQELQASKTVNNLKVCWAALVDGEYKFYGDAGKVSFADPERMVSQAKMALTTTESGALAPLVISFSPSKNSYLYRFGLGEMMLVFRFLDSGKLAPALANATRELGPAERLDRESMTQAACGVVFLELWSNAENGFPVPKGCYFSEEGAAGEGGQRELFVIFERYNGLRSYCSSVQDNCEYQLVLNAVATSIITGGFRADQVLEIDVGCLYESGGCRSRYEIFERGQVVLVAGTQEGGALGVAAKLHASSGFELLEVDGNGVYNLARGVLNYISARLRSAGPPGIQQGAILRIFLRPLTQWDVGFADARFPCSATCNASVGKTCGTILCMTENVLPDKVATVGPFAIFKLTLPTTMDLILGSVAHTVSIWNFSIPKAALFPIPLGVQLSTSSDLYPNYRSSAGFVSFLGQGSSLWDGRFVRTGWHGSGPRPFPMQQNLLYAQLRFAATLWEKATDPEGSASSAESARLEIYPPSGFSCFVERDGRAPHSYDFLPGDKPPAGLQFARDRSAPFDNTVETLVLLDRNLDDHADHVRATLSVNGSGSWHQSLGTSVCTYSFGPGQKLHAGQTVLIPLNVLNPGSALRRSAAANKWYAQLRGRGWLDAGPLYSSGMEEFLDLETSLQTENMPLELSIDSGLWVGNVAVVAPLGNVVLQPQTFSVGSDNFITVFLKISQETGADGEIVVDAPIGFSFGSICHTEDLDQSYYDPVAAPGSVRPLPTHKTCQGVPTPEALGIGSNRARVGVAGSLRAGITYAFGIQVKNPAQSLPDSNHSLWYLWTADARGLAIDASDRPAALSLAHSDVASWQLYQVWPSPPVVLVESGWLRPSSVFGLPEVLVLDGLRVSASGPVVTSLRVTAPPGCHFISPADGGFLPPRSASIPLTPMPLLDDAEQQLLWYSVRFQGGSVYGFRMLFKVDMPVTPFSGMTFFLELGFNSLQLGGRRGAASFPAPPMRAVRAAPVAYLSSRIGQRSNSLTFRFQTTSIVPPNSGAAILIRAGEHLAGMSLSCPVIAHVGRTRIGAIGGSLRLPIDIGCQVGVQPFNGAPFLMLRPSGQAIAAGSFELEVQGSNPAGANVSDTWQVGIYEKLTQDLLLQGWAIDAPAAMSGFLIRESLAFAAMLPWQGPGQRDARPGRMTTVQFAFELTSKSQAGATLVVQAPYGFYFEEDCLSSVVTNFTSFYFEGDYISSYDWPASPAVCFGQSNVASLSLPAGLDASKRYAFSLAARSPEIQPVPNTWMLELGMEASEPLQGYPLAIIAFPMPLLATSQSISGGLFAPLGVTFIILNPVPEDGLLRFYAPPGFTLGNASRLEFRAEAAVAAAGLIGSKVVAIETSVALDGSVSSVRITAAHGLLAGLPYILWFMVQNPPDGFVAPPHMSWAVASFGALGEALDEGSVDSFELMPLVSSFRVVNVNNFKYSLANVDVEVSLSFPSPVLFGDELSLQAPDGFSLVAKYPLCRNFSWSVWLSAVQAPVPSCSCTLGPCELSMTFQSESFKQERDMKGVAYATKTSLRFRIATTNPAVNPSEELNYWRIAHKRCANVTSYSGASVASSVLSSAVVPCWSILPQLQMASVELVGSIQAAGADSDLLIRFIPARPAAYVMLLAEFPMEMDFSNSAVASPFEKGPGSTGGALTVLGLSLIVGVETSVTVRAVKLGRGGGQSIFSLTTYKTSQMTDLVDERLHFPGFFQPGMVSMQGILTSRQSLQPELYPVRSKLNARAGEQAQINFRLSFTLAVAVGDRLLLSCDGSGAYQLFADSRLSFTAITPASDSGVGGQTVTLNVFVQLRGEHGLDIEFLGDVSQTDSEALEANQLADLSFWVVPTLGINSWRAETFHGPQLTNTNDGTSAGFQPVAQLVPVVQATQSSPSTQVSVKLFVSSNGVPLPPVPQLKVVAPVGFVFQAICSDICTSVGDTYGTTGRAIARLITTGLLTLLDTQQVILVKMPFHTPRELTWIVEALSSAGKAVGWGAVQGFKVNQMRDAQVIYGAVPKLKLAQLAFIFSFATEPAEDAMFTIIELSAPQSMILSCQGDNLRRMTLPGSVVTCEEDGPGQMRLSLDESLTPGTFSFTVSGTLPSQTPTQNEFSMVIRERSTEAVVDAAFNLPGWPTVQLASTQPTLAWSTAGLGRLSIVTVGFSLDNVTDTIRALLITLPDGFQQRVTSAADIKSTNSRLPLLKGAEDWLDVSVASRLRILLEATDPEMDIGQYMLTFPVLLPPSAAALPEVNLWYFTVCVDRACMDPRDTGVLVSFPMAGFSPGEVSFLETLRKQAAMDVVDSAWGNHQHQWLTLAVVAITSMTAIAIA